MDYSLLQMINIIKSDIDTKKVKSEEFVQKFNLFKEKWNKHFDENKDVEFSRSVIQSRITYQDMLNLDENSGMIARSINPLEGRGMFLLKDHDKFLEEFHLTIYQDYSSLMNE